MAEGLGRLLDQPADVVERVHVGLDGQDAPACFLGQLLGGRLQGLLAPRADGHVHPFVGKLTGDGLANAPAAAGYDGRFVRQFQVHGTFSFRNVS